MPIATGSSNAMIPVNGKPVIGWVLDDLLKKNIREAVIVAQAGNLALAKYVEWAFRGRMQVRWAWLDTPGNIIHSLLAGLSSRRNSPVTVVLGDTLITDSFYTSADYVLVSSDYDDPSNWCLAQTDENDVVLQYFDKQADAPSGLPALTGFYHFSDAAALYDAGQSALQHSGNELSDALRFYGNKHPIRAIQAQKWYDFGHMPHFLKARQDLLSARYFNRIQIEPVRGILRKSSENIEKLSDEYDWYQSLPPELSILTPRLLSGQKKENAFHLEQEYYGYPNLAELYLYGNLDRDIWKTALRNLMDVHKRLCSFQGHVSAEDARAMYGEKPLARFRAWQEENSLFGKIAALETIEWNGQTLLNLPHLLPLIESGCEQLAQNVQGGILHGDYCLSNILYDPQNQLVRLIDPRGRFGRKGIFGDPRYDMAKLRHSLNGGYDFILADLFQLDLPEPGVFRSNICRDAFHDDLAVFFDRLLNEAGYDLSEIRHIEATLFLSMLPFHRGAPERQIMMYLRAIQLLNQLR
ncbi:MAG: NTP transferase domain-containing protein [Saprospiraceae bacterium]|nr:NTP transferase domain-containing protein [Saprospiraceae bacterium]